MNFPLLRASLTVAILLGTTGMAAATPFTWNPRAVKLDGSKFTADTLVLSDYAQITFGNGGTTFTDTGVLPIVGFSLNGGPVSPTGYGALGGWGAYISYTGTGTQTLSPQGFPVAATFDQLSYEIVGYNIGQSGAPTFGFKPDGSATVIGQTPNLTTLERGSLIPGTGQLAFTGPLGAATIVGTLSATIDEVKPQFVQSKPGRFDVTFVHPPEDYSLIPPTPSSPPALQIHGGNLSTATLVSKQQSRNANVLFASEASSALVAEAAAVTTVPEPTSLALFGVGLLGFGGLGVRRRLRR